MNGQTCMSFSLAKNGSYRMTKNFTVKEFACHDGTDTVFISNQLVVILQKIRDHFKKPVNILSGYRTELWNAKNGGAQFSQHKHGMAADITITGVTPQEIAAYAAQIMPNTGGIGIYKTFCHVDVRMDKSRWNG